MQRIKKGDTIQVITGKDRGKTGKVSSWSPKNETLVVEGLNAYKKHSKPRREGEKGEVVQVFRPIPASRVMLYCESCGKGTRVGVRVDETGKSKVRYCRKCQRPF